MNGSDNDRLLTLLAAMPRMQPDEAHVEQVRSRCRTILERRSTATATEMEPITVGAICAMYAWQIVRLVIR